MAKRCRSPLRLSVEGWTSESEAENDDRSRRLGKKLKLNPQRKVSVKPRINRTVSDFEFISSAKVETLDAEDSTSVP